MHFLLRLPTPTTNNPRNLAPLPRAAVHFCSHSLKQEIASLSSKHLNL